LFIFTSVRLLIKMTINKCQGRPDGECPLGKRDSSVKNTIYDLFLCPDCIKFREDAASNASVSDNSRSAEHSTESRDTHPVKCELLCFVQDKSKTISFDQLNKICSDFYKEEEIMAAKGLLDRVVSSRLPKRQGQNKIRLTLEDIVKVVLDPTIQLPMYFAVNLARLPPVDVSHCDVSAILRELQSLRQEVRLISDLRSEVDHLKDMLAKLESSHSPMSKQEENANNVEKAIERPSYAKLAENLEESAINKIGKSKSQAVIRSVPKSKPKPLVGKAQGFGLPQIDSVRKIELFISRLPASTEVAEVTELTSSVLSYDNISAEKLQSRYDGYASFHITVSVVNSRFPEMLQLCNSEEVWPAGLLVRRFFNHGSRK
jgi:hypothetical protein